MDKRSNLVDVPSHKRYELIVLVHKDSLKTEYYSFLFITNKPRFIKKN